MMTDEQKSKAVELRATIGATSGMLSGAPVEVRAAVVELKKEVQGSGATARDLARVLGVHESTLCRWERQVRALGGVRTRGQRASSREASRFRMVRVTPAETRSAPSASGSTSPGFGLRVAHAPSGLVIDGLDVDGLAALLRRMS